MGSNPTGPANSRFLRDTLRKRIIEIDDFSKLLSEHMRELVKNESLQLLGLNWNSKQKIVPVNEVKNRVTQGWEYVTTLSTNEAIIKLPTN